MLPMSHFNKTVMNISYHLPPSSAVGTGGGGGGAGGYEAIPANI